jgi:hypothetical protein
MNNCLIWKTPAVVNQQGDSQLVNSGRAGGRYRMDGTTVAVWNNYDEAKRVTLQPKLTTWIVDQHRAGIEVPTINSDVLSHVELQRKLRHSDKIERFFLMLSEHSHTISEYIRIIGADAQKNVA